MSLILKILDILEAEVKRHLKLNSRQLEDISSLSKMDLSRLLRGVDQSLRTKILDSIDPGLVKDVLEMMDVHMEAECLYNIREEQRKLVIAAFGRERRSNEAYMKLQHWQTLEQFNWPAGILPLLVKATEIPAHYPPTMGYCVVCHGGYAKWQSIIAADCQKHSFHEKCETQEGVCPRLGCRR